MTELLFLAVEEAIPADHPAAWLAIPIGLLFLSGSVYVLLWSNYGARKAGAIYGVAFFGFSFLIGLFWWLGGPGIPAGLGISHLPGQTGDHYLEQWYAFEAGSERAALFEGATDVDAFVSLPEFAGMADTDEEQRQSDPGFSALAGSVTQAVEAMQSQYLPVDDNNIAQIGSERRAVYEADADAAMPADAHTRANPFYSAVAVGEPQLREDPDTGVLLAVQTYQTIATFVDSDGIPLDPIEVGEPMDWFAFHDPGQAWLPSMLWTLISMGLFLLSLLWLDRLEVREKRDALVEIEEAEDPAVPIAQ